MAERRLSVAGVSGLAVMTLVLTGVGLGQAQVPPLPASDRPAGYVVFPKVVVDTSDVFSQGRRVDTIIQLTNLSEKSDRAVECFYINATSRCNNGHQPCRANSDCNSGGICLASWTETDFTLVLTTNQPVGWRASVGGANVEGGGAPVPKPVESFFVGELKCVEIDKAALPSEAVPIVANDLKGEATIEEVNSGNAGSVDAREYNAIGFRALATDGDQNLCLGASPASTDCKTAEYAQCPSLLVVDHFFDYAPDPNGICVSGVASGSRCTRNAECPGGSCVFDRITSDLTLVPCSEDLTGVSSPTPITAQILVFNEFEQRFSTQTEVDCFLETQLSDIDTAQGPGGNSQSIFNFAVEGTLTGQMRIRSVLTSDPNNGNGLLAVVEEFHGSHSAAYNVDYVGTNGEKGDIVRFSAAP